jgi:hypothetical protein
MNDYYRRMWTGASYEPTLNAPPQSPAGLNDLLNRYQTMVLPQNAAQQSTGVQNTGGNVEQRARGGMIGYAHGGLSSLGNTYAAGGKLLRGPGDGMSDSIPAVIKGRNPQRAALADGEFVIPADVVSHLGNGSTEAGSKKLYAMMDKIRIARTGNKRQGKQINPAKYLPR